MLKTIRKKIMAVSGHVGFAGIALILLFSMIRLFVANLFTVYDLSCYDWFLTHDNTREKSNVPVIVDIDEQSLERYGQWPWPRYKIAELIGKISGAGPLAVGLDILFPEADRTSPVNLNAFLKKEFNLEIDFHRLPEKYHDHDRLLAETLNKTPAVLGFYCRFDSSVAPPGMPGELKHLPYRILAGQVSSRTMTDPLSAGLQAGLTRRFTATHVIAPLPTLAVAAKNLGFINAMPGPDGILRRMPMLIEYRGSLYPSLSLALIQLGYKYTEMAIQPTAEGADLHFQGKQPLRIPLDSSGQMLIHFRGKAGSYPSYSAAQVLSPQFKTTVFKEKIVLIGSSAGGLKDMHATPFDPDFIGVEAHTAAIDTVMSRDFLFFPSYSTLIQCLIFAGTGILMTGWLSRYRAGSGVLVFTALALGILGASSYWFTRTGQFISPVSTLVFSTTLFIVLTLLKYAVAEKEKRYLKKAFSKFVAKPIVDQVVASPHRLNLSGEDKSVSILFADIRQFTTLSETLSPEQTTRLLQAYFTPMTRVITRHSGTLDKFIGDGIMAFWNAPLDIPDHRAQAFQAAVDMLNALGILNETFAKEYGFTLNIGIGLHTGRVRVGNMGTTDLFNYTIIGDNVNVASRLENLSKFYGVRIIFSEEMKTYVPRTHQIQELDLVRIRGRREPLRIYGLFTGKFMADSDEHIAVYYRALGLYREQKFDRALEIFEQFRQKRVDRKLYQIYRQRCEYYLTHPPGKSWDGIFTHQQK